jgi:hypothetical protein
MLTQKIHGVREQAECVLCEGGNGHKSDLVESESKQGPFQETLGHCRSLPERKEADCECIPFRPLRSRATNIISCQ